MLTARTVDGSPRRLAQSAVWILSTVILLLTAPALAAPSGTSEARTSEIIASIKEDGNVVFYSTNQIPNRLPISLETVNLSASDDVELIDVRDNEDRFLRFKQDIGNGRNITTILCDEPVPVDGSLGLFTVSLHKDLVKQRKDTLVFEYDYTPDFSTTLKFTAIVPESATPSSVEPKPKEQVGRRFTWEYQIGAEKPFACRIKYTQKAPFGIEPIRDAEELEQMSSHTIGYWRGTSKGAGWAWFFKKGLVMPGDFRFQLNMETVKTINERRRFGIMLDPTDTGYFDRPRSESVAAPWADPWGKATYCFFWSNVDIEKVFAYGLLKNGELVISKKAPEIEVGKEYEIALEKEANQFRFFVDGEKVLEYDDQELLWSRHTLRIGVHGPMSGKEIAEVYENNKEWWKGAKTVEERNKRFDDLELSYIRYTDRKFTLIGADKYCMDLRNEYFKPVNSIDAFSPHVFNTVAPILIRLNDFDEWDFSPIDSANIDEVANIDLSKLGFRLVSSGPLKEVNIGTVHYEVPPGGESATRLIRYAKQGSDEPVLFIEMGQAPSALIAASIFNGIRGQTNWGAYNGMCFSQAFYPHLSSMGMRKGRWLIHVSLPLEEAEPSELEGKWDTIRLFMRRIAGEILMHFYEVDMNAQ